MASRHARPLEQHYNKDWPTSSITHSPYLDNRLSYIFNTYQPGMKFSDVVGDAKAKGFTEPDPREDLSGADVARKVVILARECGLQVITFRIL